MITILKGELMQGLRTTPYSARHYGVATLSGIIGGILSAMVKSGCEDILPPRPPGAVPPPIGIINDLGLSPDSMVYTFSEQVVNWGGNGIHYLFSIAIAILYCCLVEVYPKVKMACGVVFGLVVAVLGFHTIVLPILGLTAPIWQWPVDSLISELIGTPIWIIVIEMVRYYLRGRIVGSQVY